MGNMRNRLSDISNTVSYIKKRMDRNGFKWQNHDGSNDECECKDCYIRRKLDVVISYCSGVDDKETRLYKKFYVKRMDGSGEVGEKHEHCEYFVLDLNHDEFAISALAAYAISCKDKYPLLHHDIMQIIRDSAAREAAQTGKP